MCDAGIVYTKDEALYIYQTQTKQSKRINSDVSRAYLAEACGNSILWYDITGGYNDSADVVKYAKVDNINGRNRQLNLYAALVDTSVQSGWGSALLVENGIPWLRRK